MIKDRDFSRVTFKVVDAEGGTIEQYGAVAYGLHGWYEPRRRKQ